MKNNIFIDEELSNIPFKGIKELFIEPTDDDIKKGFGKFTFKDIPKGRYEISCFHYLNNNSILDKDILT